MNENLVRIKTTLVMACSSATALLGWKGIMALVWVAAMCLDYISGTAAARRAGEWKSCIARDGAWHKGGMILVVAVAGAADIVMAVICGNIPILNAEWPGMICPLVMVWYILTEMGSILENAVKMGTNVPAWLTKLLKASLGAVDQAGGHAVEGIDEGIDVDDLDTDQLRSALTQMGQQPPDAASREDLLDMIEAAAEEK